MSVRILHNQIKMSFLVEIVKKRKSRGEYEDTNGSHPAKEQDEEPFTAVETGDRQVGGCVTHAESTLI